jgi:hypothetical protein
MAPRSFSNKQLLAMAFALPPDETRSTDGRKIQGRDGAVCCIQQPFFKARFKKILDVDHPCESAEI